MSKMIAKSGTNWRYTFQWLSLQARWRDSTKVKRASYFTRDLSINTTFDQIHLARGYTFNLIFFRYVGSQKLSEMLQQPYDLYKPGWADAYIMGLINQVISF